MDDKNLGWELAKDDKFVSHLVFVISTLLNQARADTSCHLPSKIGCLYQTTLLCFSYLVFHLVSSINHMGSFFGLEAGGTVTSAAATG